MEVSHQAAKGKYTELIDEETWAFIDKTNASYPENAVELTLQEQCELYDLMCEQFRVDRPESVSVYDSVITTETHQIPIRLYLRTQSKPTAQILYFHGGGFVVGGLDSHDDVCAELCDRTGLPVTSVDYRLAPDHVFPAAFEDAVSAYEYVTTADKSHRHLPVILVGDSAGANLCAALAHEARSYRQQALGQVLIYPCLAPDMNSFSYTEHANAPLLTTDDMVFYRALFTGGQDCLSDIRCYPLADSDFSGLPKTFCFGAACDPLLDDSRIYAESIIQAGGEATFYEEKGLVHGYLRARHSVQRAAESFDRIVDAVLAVAG